MNNEYQVTMKLELDTMVDDLLFGNDMCSSKVTYEDNNVTVVTVTNYSDVFGEIKVSSSSRRNPVDKRNAKVGRELARARAMKKLANTLERRVNGMVKNIEDIEKMKANHKPTPEQYLPKPEAKKASSRRVTKKTADA